MNDKKKPVEIDVDKIDLDRLKLSTIENPGLSPFASDRGAVAFEPTKAGAIKSRAHKAMTEQLDMQMGNIMEQIHVLAKQVEDLKDRKKISEEIYNAHINFEPVSGKTYYLYEKIEDQTLHLSLLSPKDWGEDKLQIFNYKAEVVLLADHTWKVNETNYS